MFVQKKSYLLSLIAAFGALFGQAAQGGLIGPSAYLQSSDSPFSGESFEYFYLEDFEDGLLNVPGVSASAGAPNSTLSVDSVDGDDDNPADGDCSGCVSFYQPAATDGVTFTFSEAALGSLPTSAGIVWTDSRNDIFFEAFDALGASLGTLTGDHADLVFNGTTAEDRFYGVTDAGGISSIFIKGTGSGGLEVDHLQYGAAAPVPATLALLSLGLLGIASGRRRSES